MRNCLTRQSSRAVETYQSPEEESLQDSPRSQDNIPVAEPCKMTEDPPSKVQGLFWLNSPIPLISDGQSSFQNSPATEPSHNQSEGWQTKSLSFMRLSSPITDSRSQSLEGHTIFFPAMSETHALIAVKILQEFLVLLPCAEGKG